MKERALELLRVIEADIAANRLILPSLPEVAINVRNLLAKQDCTLAELEQQLAKDAAMTARLLKVANSSLLSRGQAVTSLRQALLNMGLELVGSLVTQMAILQTMKQSRDVGRLEGFVASSLQISSLCHSLASKHSHLDPELAALGGLLHDIGKLPLRDYLFANPSFSDDERLQFELILHPYVGALLLKHWQMDEQLIRMAYQHEKVMRDTGNPLPDYVDVVIAANLVHYGLEQGRYRRYAEQQIPALQKCLGEGQSLESLNLLGSAEERMEVALSMI